MIEWNRARNFLNRRFNVLRVRGNWMKKMSQGLNCNVDLINYKLKRLLLI